MMTIDVPENDLLRMTLNTAGVQTDLALGHGVLRRAPELLERYRAARLLLVSDTVVAPLYAAPLRDRLAAAGYQVHLLPIPAGEAAKTLDTVRDLYAACYALQVERADVVVAVGGGMVGDVTGLLAGTYLRGLAFVQAPTTLVAQLTASIGGKVGVNFEGHKNLIGLFNQPAMVLADLDTLATLPRDEFRSGLGELVTVGVLGAPELFAALEQRGPNPLAPLIAVAIECKRQIVDADPFERLDIRARLNLGHTFGHALEHLSDFTLPHGLAVAVGLHIAGRLAAALGLCTPELPERVARVLRKLDLPLSLRGYAPEQVLAAMRSDKKRAGGQLRFVLPVAIGAVTLVREDAIPRELLLATLRQLTSEGNE